MGLEIVKQLFQTDILNCVFGWSGGLRLFGSGLVRVQHERGFFVLGIDAVFEQERRMNFVAFLYRMMAGIRFGWFGKQNAGGEKGF